MDDKGGCWFCIREKQRAGLSKQSAIFASQYALKDLYDVPASVTTGPGDKRACARHYREETGREPPVKLSA